MVELRDLIKKSGLKALSLAKLTSVEYSVVLYLLNCLASGFSKIVTTEKELGNLIDSKTKDIKEAIESLESKKIVYIKYVDNLNPKIDDHSFSLGVETDVRKWNINSKEYKTAEDAIIYPLSRQNHAHLEVVHSELLDKKKSIEKIVETFCQGRTISNRKRGETRKAAQDLVDSYPLDGIILILKHFSKRIKSLSFLVSSWQHFEELYEQETHQVGFAQAKNQHFEKEKKLRESIDLWLSQSMRNTLSVDEIKVLEIIKNHRHPRRQLFWAFRIGHQYKNLKNFFAENSHLMLSVTNSGQIVKKK